MPSLTIYTRQHVFTWRSPFFFVSKEFQNILTITIKGTDPQLIFYLNLYLFIEMLLDSCRPDNGLI